MFACTLGNWKAKMYWNSLTNIRHYLAHHCYFKKIGFLHLMLTQYLIESCLNCNMNLKNWCQFHNIFENISLICTFLYVRKLLGQKTQNNLCARQSIGGGGHCAMKPSVIRKQKNPELLKLPSQNSLSEQLKFVVKHWPLITADL